MACRVVAPAFPSRRPLGFVGLACTFAIAVAGKGPISTCDSDDSHDVSSCTMRPAARDHVLLQHSQVAILKASRLAGPSRGSNVLVNGRKLLVDGVPFHMKGINWNPIGWNDTEPEDRKIDYWSYAEQDADLMAAAGINAVRTYGPLTDVRVLDALWARGIWVANTAYANGRWSPETARAVVAAVKDHPAILMWVIGNEWNYNGLYAQHPRWKSMELINEAARIIREVDQSHPISTIYGGVPSWRTVNDMPDISVWGLNVYNGLSFGGMFDAWKRTSDKPMYLGEYGADALDARFNTENEEAQAEATMALTNEIVANSAVHEGGSCIGGFLFEFADEWWKDSSGSAAEHDLHGIAPGGGPHPDRTFNEEWWGIVRVTREPRQAYYAYMDTPLPGSDSTTWPTSAPAPTPAGACKAARVQRRRRNIDMCACRRRSSVDGGSAWTCEGPSLVLAPGGTAPGRSFCDAGQVQRRRRYSSMCACRRRSGGADLAQGWTCRGDAVVLEDEGAPTSPPPCTANAVQRRRRDADMCGCRRRSGVADLSSGWACKGDVIATGEGQ
eukprot:CAMPEP_0117559688 /NCGR_PEP_ID=MMETSP0784-20121206/53490_1 /TAXON_ID=39447 /ORGANISM="" /LENGTH=556 /DNA_ID=CAMNT_0005357075 /DNA_START=36 /DNA_END=1706 /DNA_ORIENTATION=+